MIEDRDADFLAGNSSVIIHPVRAFPPDTFLAPGSVRVDHVPRRRVQCLHHTNRKGTLFGVAEDDLTMGGEDGKFTVDDSGFLVSSEAVPLCLFGQDASRRDEIERGLQDAAVRAAA